MSNTPPDEAPAHKDGRVRRAERSREAIVQALLALVGEGLLRPTAQQVADRAQVGIRTVFRHFSDMDTLHASLASRIRAEVEPLLKADPPSGSLEARARALAAQRCDLYERIAPYRRSARIHRWNSAFLSRQQARESREQRAHLLRWLPEVRDLDEASADAIEAALSFESWDRLRGEQRLGAGRTRAACERTLCALLGVA